MRFTQQFGAIGVVLATLTGSATHAQDLIITPLGRGLLLSGPNNAHELSGMTWAGGETFQIVSDTDGRMHELRIAVDRATGAMTSTQWTNVTTLTPGADLEGLAMIPSAGDVWASDEVGPMVRQYDATTGAVLFELTLPDVFLRIRPNFGLESLSLVSGRRALWTCNEEALEGDGALATVSSGSTVRLQRFDANHTPAGQWAYITDPITADSVFVDEERSGVSDLLVLPDERVLVLERELGGVGFFGIPEFRARIYLVDFTNATDTSDIVFLDDAPFMPVAKTLLWQGTSITDNYEGMTLGQQLDDGSYSLFLVSDDGGTLTQTLYAMRLDGVGPFLQHDPLVRGTDVTFTMSGANPGETVFFLYSLRGEGAGPRLSQLGDLRLNLVPPIIVSGSAVANGEGVASLTTRVPANAPLVNVSTQAVLRRGDLGEASIKSNASTAPILP